MRNYLTPLVLALAFLHGAASAAPDEADAAYFHKYASLRMSREGGILTVEMHTRDGPITFTARDHEAFVDAFYEIGRDRGNRVVILTGAGGEWMRGIDFASFGDVGNPEVWAKIHDEGTQVLENIANIRVPVICAVEGHALVHTEYCLLAKSIVAADNAVFSDLPHFNGGIVPGDGIFTLWSYYVGPGRAQAMLLDPKPLSARAAFELGVVGEVVSAGRALARAKEIARDWLKKPTLTLRYTRVHFIQPIKERIVREVGYGLALEGESADALVRSMRK